MRQHRYTGSRLLAARLNPLRSSAVQRLLRLFQGQASGATIVEYLLVGGLCAIGIITAYRRYRAHSTVVIRNEAKMVATLTSHEPDEVISALGGFDRVRELDGCDPNVGCLIPGVECFAAGTLVATESGDRPIETIREGELVWSRDAASGVTELRPVERVFVKQAASVIELELQSEGQSETLTVTPDHPFWVDDRGWLPAKSLGAEPLWSPDTWLTANAIATFSKPTTVYNLEVAGFHTYFVGASHAWVHNQCEDFDPQRDCIDPVLSLPHTRYRGARQAELEALCNSGNYRYNPATGRLRSVENPPPPVTRPCLKQASSTHTPTDEFAADRQVLLDERAREFCNRNNPVVNNISERLGENAGHEFAQTNFPRSEGWTPLNTDGLGSGAHSYDVVYTRTNPTTGEFEVVLIEAKGGITGELGTRWEDRGPDALPADEQRRVQQGTMEYAQTIAQAMRRDPARRVLGQQILNALNDGNARYFKVHQRVGDVDCNSNPRTGQPGRIEVGEFAIYDADRADNGSCR